MTQGMVTHSPESGARKKSALKNNKVRNECEVRKRKKSNHSMHVKDSQIVIQ